MHTRLACSNTCACAGRVKRCSSKQVDVISIGTLRLDPGWHNKGYIFPDGFTARTIFRSSVSARPETAIAQSSISKPVRQQPKNMTGSDKYCLYISTIHTEPHSDLLKREYHNIGTLHGGRNQRSQTQQSCIYCAATILHLSDDQY